MDMRVLFTDKPIRHEKGDTEGQLFHCWSTRERIASHVVISKELFLDMAKQYIPTASHSIDPLQERIPEMECYFEDG